MFLAAYPREAQEMVFDTHIQAFEHFGGAPKRMMYDNPKTIVDVRDRILRQDKGDRAFVELLLMARALGNTGLEALEVACNLTLQTGIIAAAIVMNEMRRLSETVRLKQLSALSAPSLQIEPKADCSRYDSLRRMRYDQ
jgi:hypothetical protein